jgi:oligopeptide/dipeptide ABC transporter ATP-binding protein
MTASAEAAALSVRELRVHYALQSGVAVATDDVSFDIKPGQVVGLVGESGSGKSTVARAILRLLPSNGSIVAGEILLAGSDLMRLDQAAFRAHRWRALSYIPQNALSALDPVARVGKQMAEPLLVHSHMSQREAKRLVVEALRKVHLDPAVARAFPHQLSGGMRQRVLIAMALVLEPAIVVIDEPTTALDVISQQEVLREFQRVRTVSRSGMLYVSHDLGVVRGLCDEVLVMYGGRIVERGSAADVFGGPGHPFTMGLLYAVPRSRGAAQLVSIPGAPPDLRSPLVGCPFAPRCPFAVERCRSETPPVVAAGGDAGHLAACHRVAEANELRPKAALSATWEGIGASTEAIPA